jgi:hypothetical protein
MAPLFQLMALQLSWNVAALPSKVMKVDGAVKRRVHVVMVLLAIMCHSVVKEHPIECYSTRVFV